MIWLQVYDFYFFPTHYTLSKKKKNLLKEADTNLLMPCSYLTLALELKASLINRAFEALYNTAPAP